MGELKQKLLTCKKYRDVCPDTLERIWNECALKFKKEKDVNHAVREALHGVTGAFMTERETKCAMEFAQSRDWESLLGMHASTRERLPIENLERVTDRILEVVGTPASILDLACGLNPIWLVHRFENAKIAGYDISGQCVRIIRAFGGAEAQLCDLLCTVPSQQADVALLFKVLPLLERQKAGAAMRVLESLNVKNIVASFPTRSLSGRDVGMEKHYSEWMEEHIPENRTVAARFTEGNEMFYILK